MGNVSEILQLIEIKKIYWGLSSCLALGIMARPGATCPEYYIVAVILRRPKIQNWVHGSQVWAREWWNIGMLVLKEVSHLLMRLRRINFLVNSVLPTNHSPSLPEPIIPVFHCSLAQTWLAKDAYKDLTCEILRRPPYVPAMSRQGGPTFQLWAKRTKFFHAPLYL